MSIINPELNVPGGDEEKMTRIWTGEQETSPRVSLRVSPADSAPPGGLNMDSGQFSGPYNHVDALQHDSVGLNV